MAEQRLVLAARRLALGRVHDDERAAPGVRHGPQLRPGREASATAAAQPARLGDGDEVAAPVERSEDVEMLVERHGPAVAADGCENPAHARGREHGAARCGQRHAGCPSTEPLTTPEPESMFSANWSWSSSPAPVLTTVWTSWPLSAVTLPV